MMNFRVVNAAIIKLLGDSAASRYRVIGYQKQGADASGVRGDNRSVQSYFSTGDFANSARRQNELTFTIGLSVSAASRLDLAVINNPASTTQQITAAMSAMQDAAYCADVLIDELADIVYQILMDGNNYDFGLSVGTVSSRQVSTIRKDPPLPAGSLVTLTGAIELRCRVSEDVGGAVPVAAEPPVVVTNLEVANG